ncbi:hypothetical protein Lal_00042337 [Lupinus albus]|nr:hypothetical protein Lal_00042337 [Lupinus albus]
MSKDPKFGGGAGGTCEVTKNQTQHSPRNLDTNFVSVSEHLVAENTAFEHSNSVHYVAFPDFYHYVHYENMAQPPTPLDPRERTLRELDAPDFTYDKNTAFEHSNSVHFVAFPDFYHSVHSENMAQPPTPHGPRERTLRELASPDFTYDSLCIQYEDVPYVLKTGLIHLWPKFNGLAVRQNRNLDTKFVSVSEHPVVENTTSKHSDSLHSVAFPNFYHSVHSENMAQLQTPPGPREWTLRELAAPDYTYDSLCVQYEDVPYVYFLFFKSINPEIDRTYHRLVRHNWNLDTNFVFVSELPVAENTASEHYHSVHYVAFPDFYHSVHSENMDQPPTPPGPRERTLRELTAPDFTYDSLCIQYEDVPYVHSETSKQGESTSKSNPLNLTRLLANDAQRKVFEENFHGRAIFTPKYGNIGNFEFEDFIFPYLLRQQKLFDFCCKANNIYPELVRILYCNMNFRKNLMTSHEEIERRKQQSLGETVKNRGIFSTGYLTLEDCLIHYFLSCHFAKIFKPFANK